MIFEGPDRRPRPCAWGVRFGRASENAEWSSLACSLLKIRATAAAGAALHSEWTARGHHIRHQIGDDRLVCQLLRHMLPRYTGPSMRLYRGENLQRFREGKIGFCWTPRYKVAADFASVLNAGSGGGVLLSTTAQPEAILAGPSAHSSWLGEDEYVVDPSLLSALLPIRHYPSSP